MAWVYLVFGLGVWRHLCCGQVARATYLKSTTQSFTSNRNFAKMTVHEEELLRRIRELEKKNGYLNQQLKEHRYGLTWIDVPEAFEKASENKIPVLEEVKEKSFTDGSEKPTHILIEGDNYHALTCLQYTHKGKIDVIYIDPPYNTGSDGFTYKDKRILTQYPDGTPVPKDHPLRHSYWLSFMHKRLELAKNLLSDDGVIFISIDDNEQANLKLLCDSVFDGKNHIATLPTIMNLKGNQDEYGFAGTHEYTMVYSRNPLSALFNSFPIDDDDLADWNIDEIGYYKQGATLKRTGVDAPREKRPYSYYPILISPTGVVTSITHEEHKKIYIPQNKTFDDDYVESLKEKYEQQGYLFVLPMIGDNKASWRWKFDKVANNINEIIVTSGRDGISLYKKQRPEIGDLPSKKPKTIFYKPEYSSGNGTAQLKFIFGEKIFNNPKPIELIKDFILLGSKKDSIILDFFAGSGTTLHATLKLNAEDRGTRQCILVQQNEGEKRICEEVTYERNRRVMQGYTNSEGKKIDGLGGSLKYYKTAFTGTGNPHRDPIMLPSDEDRISLAQNAGVLVSLAENTLYEIVKNDCYQIFTNNHGRFAAVYLQEDLKQFEDFKQGIEKLGGNVTVYIFSWGNNPDAANAFMHLSNVEVKSYPNAILDAYKSALQQIESQK